MLLVKTVRNSLPTNWIRCPPAFPAGGFKINGVSDILSIGKNKLLMIERSFHRGAYPAPSNYI
jgi:hypothetical protein